MSTNAKKMLMVAPSGTPSITDYTWTQRSAGTNRNWNCVAADDSGNVVIGSDAGYVNTSSNSGVSWGTQQSVRYGRNWISAATDGNGMFVLGNNYGNLSYSTNNGASWTNPSSPSAFGDMSDILWDGNRFISAVSYPNGSLSRLYQINGTTISTLSNGFATGRWLRGAAYDGTSYAIAADAGRVYYTSDFSTWTYHSFGDGQEYQDVAVNDSGLWIASSVGKMHTSSNLSSWTQLTDASVYGGMVEFSSEYNAFLSTRNNAQNLSGKTRAAPGDDPSVWTAQTLGANTIQFNGIALAGGDTWVVVGDGGKIYTGVPT